MDHREQELYGRKLDRYRELQEQEERIYHRAKDYNPKFAMPIENKLKISGLHVELSLYDKPVWKGMVRDELAIQEGVEKRKESMEIKKQMDEEIEALLARHPDISVTKNPAAVAELEEIKKRYAPLIPTREDNSKRKINKLKSKIQANFDEWTHFITLTFRDNLYDTKNAKKKFEKWVEKVKPLYPDFKYIYVLEFQERGACHFHVLASMDKGKRVSKEKFKQTVDTWKHGNIDIAGINYKYTRMPKKHKEDATEELRELSVSEKIKTIWSVGNYLTSYLKKGSNSVLLFNSKMYGCSADLKAEIVITNPKKIAQVLGELGLEQYKEKTYTIKIQETDNTVIKKFYNMLIKNDDTPYE